jgi:hypothetical protein
MREFGYDSCLEIRDSDEFFRAIAVKVRHQLRFWGTAKVVYRDRTMRVDENESIPPAFIKPPCEFIERNALTVANLDV